MTRLRVIVGLGLLLATVCVPSGPALAGTAGVGESGSVNRPWEQYNLSPSSRTVSPVRVTRTTGTVADPANVLRGRATVLTGRGSSVTLDFGKEVGGLVSLHFGAGNTAEQRLGLAFSESSQYIGPVSDASNGGGGNTDGAIVAPVGAGSTWTMPHSSLRGGFRYLTLFADSDGPISVDRVSLAISFAPAMANLRDYDNYFYSSDPLLNRIWYAGAYTIQTNIIAPTTGRVWGPPSTGWNNSGTVGVGDEVLADGAKRDRTVWPGDLGVSVPTEYASLGGDLAPTRNALTTLYQHQTAAGELPFAGPEVNFYGSDTYHLWTLIGTANYYQYSHDTEWLTSQWANYRKAMQYSLAKVGADGLMSVTGVNDWARSGQGGKNISANSLLYHALTTGAELATIEADPTTAAGWSAAAATVKAAVNQLLWDDAAGRYRDNPASSLYPQDGNSVAVWFGVAPADRAQRISAALTTNWNAFGATTPEKNSEIGTFPGSMEIQAHLQAGNATRALDLIRREWGYMLDSPLGTGSTFWEGYLANGQFGYGGAYMSTAHGWATGPTSALTFNVLGIRPTSIVGGYDIHPAPGDLASAEGSLRTPLGTIKVGWRHDVRNSRFTEQVDAPTQAVKQIKVPTFGARTRVTVNGKLAWDGNRSRGFGAKLDGDYVVLTGAPAHSTLISQAVGEVPTTLDVSATSTSSAPVRAGQDLTVPVTVTARGDAVLRGTVTASVPAGWTADPANFTLDTRNGPISSVVDVTLHPPAVARGGEQSVTLTATADHVSAQTSLPVIIFGNWLANTTATASSWHAPNVFEGQVRTYDPSNAIDGNSATFWNDDTPGGFPDTLTVTSPTSISLNGVGFASIVDGVPTDFTVQTFDGTTWTTQAQVSGNTALARWIPFSSNVSATSVRIVVTASQPQNGNFTRIAELTP